MLPCWSSFRKLILLLCASAIISLSPLAFHDLHSRSMLGWSWQTWFKRRYQERTKGRISACGYFRVYDTQNPFRERSLRIYSSGHLISRPGVWSSCEDFICRFKWKSSIGSWSILICDSFLFVQWSSNLPFKADSALDSSKLSSAIVRASTECACTYLPAGMSGPCFSLHPRPETCLFGGTCVNGSAVCVCPSGYSADNLLFHNGNWWVGWPLQ